MDKLDWTKAKRDAASSLARAQRHPAYRILRDAYSIFGGSCPRCGGQTVQREGKAAPFFGCRTYPICRGIWKPPKP